jgi:serine phosphatase RsbU (regulator of sigma subunit)
MRDLPLRKYDGHLASRPEINKAAAGRGLLSADSSDRIVRRVPFVARIGNVVVPALSLESLRVAVGAQVLRIDDRGGERVEVVLGDVTIPLQSDGSFYVYFSPHDPERFVSAADVFSGDAAAELLAGKVVLIGVSGLGLLDYQATPLGERIPGVEVHAQIIEQIFDGAYLRRPAGATWIEALALLVAGLLFIFFVPDVRPASRALLLTGSLAVIVGGALVAFRFGLLFNAAAPAFGTLLFFGAVIAATLAEADRQRRLLREAQARVAGELEAARRIQMGLLPSPSKFAAEKRFSVDALLDPASTVGGDFYDCFMLDDDKFFFVVADVSGKGLAASLFMALSKALLKSIALRRGDDLAWTLARASKEINRDNREALFVTALAGVLDAKTGRLMVCNAGHEPPVICRAGGKPERSSDPSGPPLCVVPDYTYHAVEHTLAPGEWFCVITDGITEAMDERKRLYGMARVLEATGRLPAAAAPTAVIGALRDDVRHFAGRAEQSDDITLLCVRWNSA